MRAKALGAALIAAVCTATGAATGAWAQTAGGPALAPSAAPIGIAPLADGTEAGLIPKVAPAPTTVAITPDPDSPAIPADPQDAATVLADQIVLQGDRTLIARGGVVVWYQGARLVATALRVDGATGTLSLDGPIHLTRPGDAGSADEITLIADSAQLDRQLQEGILRGARLVIARELQLAATELRREQGGRMTRLTHVVASSCHICAEDPTPLWEIRAREITHDAETHTLRLDHPQFRAFGLPVAGLPFAISAPDPTVDRRTGLLRPEIRTTSGLGFGIKLPYFITLGRHADLTLTPYLSASRTRTLQARYRQAFSNGAMQLQGAVSRDDLKPGETRAYLFGAAVFDLPRGYRLGVQAQTASDRAYLLDYDISDADRLWSGVTLDRVRRDKLFAARVGNYESLREDEAPATSPAQVADVIWRRRIVPELIGGQALLSWSVHAHRRPSDEDIIGRDMARASVGLDWRRGAILPGGVLGAVLAGFDADLYAIAQDSRHDDMVTRATPYLGAELRWPLISHAGNATHLVEPVAQLLYSPDRGSDVPNEDSRLIEFDEGNLFATSRFPGWDARERGLRANLGLRWTRLDPTGWTLGVTAGRVIRHKPDPGFGPDSPLAGRRSDWLLATQFDSGRGLVIANRALFDDDLDFSRNELRLGWQRRGLQISAGYLWIDRDRGESRAFDTSEMVLATGFQPAPGWWTTLDARYDFAASRMQKATLGVQYRNECVTVEAGLSRRFTSSDSLRAETDFDLSVRLGGFGRKASGPGEVARRSCMR